VVKVAREFSVHVGLTQFDGDFRVVSLQLSRNAVLFEIGMFLSD